ncbi:hypothetical protein [Streptomyces sp. NPDC045470]|uniref:hypothetical protein n=1 Tax=Streptomyces sp. NPDC045470 TaxID=3155469 RepID=UPI003402AEF5
MISQADLSVMRAQLATINDLAFDLNTAATGPQVAELHAALRSAVETTGALLRPGAARAGCRRHPHGPIDPVAPAGWGPCLLCNTARRRAGHASQPR